MSIPSPAFQIPGYQIIRRLGRGGMATVYLAVQQSLVRLVAIKVLASAPDEELVQRFENEARTIARLDHPHIVSIYEVGRTPGGQIYYTMPYLPNGDLAARNLRDDPARVLAIVRALAEALACAHHHGIVHRDVKPENVLFDKLDRPLLTDFGIALSGGHRARLTREGATIGSSGYMSPEQARGQPLDGRADVYSLGVVCFELLTGETPFQGADALALALAHIEKPVPRLPATRRVWQPLIDRALAKLPDARFQSAGELLAALDVVERRMRAPEPTGLAAGWRAAVERARAIPRRRLRVLGFGALLLALAALPALLQRAPERAAAAPATALIEAVPETAAPAEAAGDATPPSEIMPESMPAPAAPTTVADPAEPDAAAAATEPDPAARRAQRLRRAAALLARGRLIGAGDDNAAAQYLAILADEPGQPDAGAGLGKILESFAAAAANAIRAGDAAAANAPLTQGVALATRAKLLAAPAFVAPIRDAVAERRARPRGPFDTTTLADLAPLLPALAKIDRNQADALRADLARPAKLLRNGGRFRDVGGPEMVAIPATGGAGHAFAIGTGEVSRGAYARFVAASGRAPARCRESQSLFARSKGLAWREPGFAQGDDHPVVCVSWDDADAYARWLSLRTGAQYRLPTPQEWLAVARTAGAGHACAAADCDVDEMRTVPTGRSAPTAAGVHDIAGNVSEWVTGCAKPSGDEAGCRERAFRGLSWRDDARKSNLEHAGTASPGQGYANIGFRLVRELPRGDDASS